MLLIYPDFALLTRCALKQLECHILSSRNKIEYFEKKWQTGAVFTCKTCLPAIIKACCILMEKVKDTLRATVRLSYDGKVYKIFHGPNADERFTNEVRVLQYLESRNCPFVPKLLAVEPEKHQIVTTNCGTRVDHIDDDRLRELFAELETYGVRHDDQDKRNVTYRQSDGRFCLIDFELATILPGPGTLP